MRLTLNLNDNKGFEEACTRSRVLIEEARILASRALAGESSVRRLGLGLEYEDFREYRPGDDLRMIDWRVTARMPDPVAGYRLMVRERRTERRVRVAVLVDLTASQDFGEKASAVLFTCSLIAWVLEALGDYVAVAVLSSGVRVAWSLRGRALPVFVTREVCSARPTGSVGLLEGVKALSAGVRRAGLLVLTDYAHTPEDFRRSLTAARALGLRPYVILALDPWEVAELGEEVLLQDVERDEVGWGPEVSRAVRRHLEAVRNVLTSMRVRWVEVMGVEGARRRVNEVLELVARAREEGSSGPGA